MSERTSKGARRKIIGRYADWIKKFDVEEYRDNPPLIEKLHEEKQLALVAADELEDQLHSAQSELQHLQFENQRFRQLLADASRRSSVAFGLSVLAILLIGFGINLSSGNPRSWVGWVMIGGGCLAEVFAFSLKPRQIDA